VGGRISVYCENTSMIFDVIFGLFGMCMYAFFYFLLPLSTLFTVIGINQVLTYIFSGLGYLGGVFNVSAIVEVYLYIILITFARYTFNFMIFMYSLLPIPFRSIVVNKRSV